METLIPRPAPKIQRGGTYAAQSQSSVRYSQRPNSVVKVSTRGPAMDPIIDETDLEPVVIESVEIESIDSDADPDEFMEYVFPVVRSSSRAVAVDMGNARDDDDDDDVNNYHNFNNNQDGRHMSQKRSKRVNFARIRNHPNEVSNRGFRSTVLNPEFSQKLNKGHVNRSASDLITKNHVRKFKWLKYSAWSVWALALMIIFGSGGWAYPDGSNPTCIEGNSSHNGSMCGVVEVMLFGEGVLRFLTAFTLAGFLASTRTLWLTKRSAYAALCGSTRNLLINVTTLVPCKESRKLLARWAVLGYELSVLKARLLIDTNEGKAYLTLSRLLVGDEWESMTVGDRHTTVWYWIQTKAKQLKDCGDIDAFELQTICNAVTLSRDRANDLMSALDRDQPPPYVFVCAILVNVNLLMTATSWGLSWSRWMNDAAGGMGVAGGMWIFAEPRLYCAVAILYIFTSIFALLFDVCSVLYCPFGPRPFDIRHDIIGSGIRHLGISLSQEGGCVPSSIDEERHTVFESNASAVALAERDMAKNMDGYNKRNTLLGDFRFMGKSQRLTS